MKLKPKQEIFCQEFMIDLNATQAAIRAGYSANTANKVGPRMLVNVGIQKKIQELKTERQARLNLSVDDVVQNLARIAFSKQPDSKTRCHDKLKALELLGRHLGMFNNRAKVEAEPNSKIVFV